MRSDPIRNLQSAIRNLFILHPSSFILLFAVAGCFSSPPPLPPHEALAKTAQRIQQILDDERKVPAEPVRFPQEAVANPNEVTFWFCSHPLISHAILAHPERVEAFQSAHPGITLDHQFIGDWNVAIQKLTVTLAAGDVPDIALVKRAWLARLIGSGWAAPLDDLLPPKLLDDFRPEALQPLKRNAHLYALPADGFCTILYYNKEKLDFPSDNVHPVHNVHNVHNVHPVHNVHSVHSVLPIPPIPPILPIPPIPPAHASAAPDNPSESRRDAPNPQFLQPTAYSLQPTAYSLSIPSTWNELRQRARELSQPNEDPRKAIHGLGHLPFLETLWSAGGEVCDEIKCLLDSDNARESIDFIVSLRNDELAHPRAFGDPRSALDLLLAGRVAMTVASSECLPYTRNAKFPIGLAPVPGKNGPISQQSDNVLVVFAKHANAKRDAIAAILDFLTGPAIQDPDAFQNGSTPTRKSLIENAPVPEGLQAAYRVSRNTPLIPASAAINYELDTTLARCFAP